MSPSWTAGVGGLEVGGRDDFPALLGDVEHGGVAEEAVRGDGGQVVAALDHVDGGVHVGARVQAGDDAPGEHAVLGVLDGALHAHVELARLGRDPVPPHVAELDELEPGVGVFDDSCHNSLSFGMVRSGEPLRSAHGGLDDVAMPWPPAMQMPASP